MDLLSFATCENSMDKWKQKLENVRPCGKLPPRILLLIAHTADDSEQSSNWIEWRFFYSCDQIFITSFWMSSIGDLLHLTVCACSQMLQNLPAHVISVHVWNMWAMCGQLRQPAPPITPRPNLDILSHHHEKEFSESVTAAAVPCFPTLGEREKREQGMERVTSLSVRPGLSHGDDWKADVTQCVAASESSRKRRMGSFIFRGRGGKSERWLCEWCLLLRSERLALAAAVWKVLQSAWLRADSGLAVRPSTNTKNLVCGTM